MNLTILLLVSIAGTVSGTLTGCLNPRARKLYLELFGAGIVGFVMLAFVAAAPATFGLENMADVLGILRYFAAFGACVGFFGGVTAFIFK